MRRVRGAGTSSDTASEASVGIAGALRPLEGRAVVAAALLLGLKLLSNV
ncbi:hypothetical protein [Brytella acorum]|nr:hypothetical protein [Brytella acorum]MDF3624522.1 hypothetical protein [Brytella acorum]